MTGSRPIPVAEGLFTWPARRAPADRGAMRGLRSGRVPGRPACERCGGTEVSETLLSDRGTLWTFTTQDFRPPSPPYDGTEGAETFQPYALGYVELPGEVMVEARLTEPDPARLAIGQPMRLAIVPYTVRADGTEVLTFAFAPLPGGTSPQTPPLGGTSPPNPPGRGFRPRPQEA